MSGHSGKQEEVEVDMQKTLDQQRAAVRKLRVTHTHPQDEDWRQVGSEGCVGFQVFAWQWCEG